MGTGEKKYPGEMYNQNGNLKPAETGYFEPPIEESRGLKGWVYVISNKAMPGLIKVGFSTKDPKLRAQQLDSTGIPHSFDVDFEALVEQPYEVEQKAHALLEQFHEGKEWFRCAASEAVTAIKNVLEGKILYEKYWLAELEQIEARRREKEEEEKARKIQEELERRMQEQREHRKEEEERRARIHAEERKKKLAILEDRKKEIVARYNKAIRWEYSSFSKYFGIVFYFMIIYLISIIALAIMMFPISKSGIFANISAIEGIIMGYGSLSLAIYLFYIYWPRINKKTSFDLRYREYTYRRDLELEEIERTIKELR